MRVVPIKVDTKQSCGNSSKIRNIFGINNSPTMHFKPRTALQLSLFRELNPGCVRHHDATIDNRTYALIDVSRIFPLFHLDENDPSNYYFVETDDYLSLISEYPIEFRLGESIDHSRYSRRVNPPTDYEKWARICLNILRHYKDGWANGMHLNIPRVSIWEEPDTNPQLFTGSPDQYNELYVTAYKVLHAEYPELIIGGPNCDSKHLDQYEGMLVRCKEAGIEPGFLGITVYVRDVDTVVDLVWKMRSMLDRYGFYNTGISFSEWHLGPYEWNDIGGDYSISKLGFDGAENAAFTVSALIRLLDTPIDYAFFYAWITGMWGVVYDECDGIKPLPVYHAVKYYTDMTVAKARLAVETDNADDVSVLAAEMEDGRVHLLISAYNAAAAEFVCSVPGYQACTLKMVCDREPEDTAVIAKALSADENGGFHATLPNGGSGVFLLEFTQK